MTKLTDSSLSASRWNDRYERMLQWGYEQAVRLKNELYEDGYPPGSAPLPDEEMWANLLAWSDAQDPRFYSKEAIRQYARLYKKFNGQRKPPPEEEPAPNLMA